MPILVNALHVFKRTSWMAWLQKLVRDRMVQCDWGDSPFGDGALADARAIEASHHPTQLMQVDKNVVAEGGDETHTTDSASS